MSDAGQAQSIFLLTGSVQGGKTTFLSALAALLNNRGLTLGGFLCPGTFDSGNRSEFYLKNILTGVEIPMGSVRETLHWFKYRRFWFNPEAFKQGEEWIRESLRQEAQIIVVDEVGPMEMEGSGWSEILDDLVKMPVPLQLWSVRENILQEVMQRWDVPPEHLIRIDTMDVNQAAALIKGVLKNYRE